jgi:hypothetical protein
LRGGWRPTNQSNAAQDVQSLTATDANGYGEERKLVPVTLPKLAWLNDTAQQQDIAERATQFVEYRTGLGVGTTVAYSRNG